MRRLAVVAVLVSLAGGVAACGQSTTTGGATEATGVVPAARGDGGGTRNSDTTVPRGDTDTTKRRGTSTTTSSTPTSSSSSSTSTTTGSGTPNGGDSISAAQFKQRVGEVCQAFKTEGDNMFKGSSSAAPTAEQFDQLVALFTKFEANVKAIGTPKELESELTAFYAKWEEFIATFVKMKAAITGGDPSALNGNDDIDRLGDEIEAIGKNLGMDACFSSTTSTTRAAR